MTELARAGVVPALQRRRGAPQNTHGAVRPGTHDGQVPRVVPGCLRLLVTPVVFLVDDHGAEVGEGREQRGAGPDRDAAFTTAQATPRIVPLPVGEARVQDRDLVAEVCPEAKHRLRCQGDLGDEHDGGPTLGEYRSQQLDVDQRLAGSGDTLEQIGRRLRFVQSGAEGVERRALMRREFVTHGVTRRHVDEGVPELLLVHDLDQLFLFEPRDDCAAEPLVPRHRGEFRAPACGFEVGEGLLLAAGPAEDLIAFRQDLEVPGDSHHAPGLHTRFGGRHGLVGQGTPGRQRPDLGPDRPHGQCVAQRLDPYRARMFAQTRDDTSFTLAKRVGPLRLLGTPGLRERQVVTRNVREHGRHGRPDRDPQGGHVVVRNPAAQREKVFGNGRMRIEHVEDRLDSLDGFGRTRPHDPADALLPSERNEYARPRRRRRPLDFVRERAVNRERKRDVDPRAVLTQSSSNRKISDCTSEGVTSGPFAPQ